MADEAGRVDPGATARREHSVRATAALELHLLRHGEPDWAPDDRAVGDPTLTPFGRQQAEAAAQVLGKLSLDAIYVSPYRRAQETAQPLARESGLAPHTVEEIAEIGISLSGVSQTEVDAFFVEAARRPLEEHWEGWPGSERFVDFHARVVRGLETILARHGVTPERRDDFTIWHVPEPGLSLGIVAHGGTNAVLVTHLLDIRPVPWEWLRFESELCAFSTLQARPLGPEGHVFALVNFNELDHLRAAGLR